MKDRTYYKQFEETLVEELLSVCDTYPKSVDANAPFIITVDEINEVWDRVAPEYMVDAVKNVNQYPKYTFAVPGFFGLALAKLWDECWADNSAITYAELCGPEMFDNADEYILQHFLDRQLNTEESEKLSDQMRTFAQHAMDKIRHEDIEPQTTQAYYVLAHSARAVFRASVALELSKRGYKYQKEERYFS